jgi:hypothetical protein
VFPCDGESDDQPYRRNRQGHDLTPPTVLELPFDLLVEQIREPVVTVGSISARSRIWVHLPQELAMALDELVWILLG